jgi:gliding motility-associated-like protein
MFKRVKKYYKLVFVLFLFVTQSYRTWSQCGSFISTFPYTEGFESAPAWTAGGTNSDWAWGTPAHPILNSAGGGAKSWCVGGLTGSFYNYSQDSWLKSPCFDFTNLNHPWISFKIFWEDEWKYDGLVLQYSLNAGSTWTNLGAYGDAVDCMNDNWYDYNNITWLVSANPKQGWTGRTGATSGSCQGGNGSMGWVTAKHCMTALANKPSVVFRFVFGAGTNCNNFDGIAIDDVLIDDAPPNVASFTYSCGGVNLLNFTNTSTPCPTGYSWNFGDSGSGAANASTLQNPSHAFSAPGTYNVKLISSGPCNAPDSITVPITVLSVYTMVNDVSCNGASNGTATAYALGGNGTYTYLWAPGGQTTQTITGLAAGTYTVSIPNSCPAATIASVGINGASSLLATPSITASLTCFGSTNGALGASATGGIPPYTFLWNTGATTTALTNLASGAYCLTASDSAGCTDTTCINLVDPQPVTVVATDQTICKGQSSSVTANASGGIAPYTYNWNNGAYLGQTYSSTPTLDVTYSVTAMDTNGCVSVIDTARVTILSPLGVSITPSSNVCAGQNINLTATASGGNGNYSYLWTPGNATGNTISTILNAPTTYTVTVTDGCTVVPAQDSTTIAIEPSPVVSFSADVLSGCPVLCVNFSDASNVPGGTISGWQWAFGDSSVSSNQNPAHCYVSGGVYNVSLMVTSANGCVNTLVKSNYIDVFPMPTAAFSATPPTTDIYNPIISFTDATTLLSGSISSWNWMFGDNTTSNIESPQHTYQSIDTYPVTLIVTSDMGCIDSAFSRVDITNGFTFYAPNAFTPDGDGKNEVFLPKGTGWDDATYNLWIFDRWGNLCFYTTDVTKGWNGKVKASITLTLSDVYVWKVEVTDTSKKNHRYYGVVTVVQ